MKRDNQATIIRDLNRKIILARAYVEDFNSLLSKSAIYDFSSVSPVLFLGVLKNLADFLTIDLVEIEEELEQLLKTKGGIEKDVISEIQNRIKASAAAGVRLARFTEYIEGARVENVPAGLLAQLHRFCAKIDPTVHLIIRPRWSFNYDSMEAKQALYKAALGDIDIGYFLTTQPPFWILSFPKTERNNLLKHAALGHEISHMLQKRLGKEIGSDEMEYETQGPDFLTATTLSSHLFREIKVGEQEIIPLAQYMQKNKWEATEDGEIDHDTLLRAKGLVWEVQYNWITEIVCDLLATRILGPSTLFAFNEILEPQIYQTTTASTTHPPAKMRIRAMAKLLREAGYIDIQDVEKRSSLWGSYEALLEKEVSRILEDSESIGHVPTNTIPINPLSKPRYLDYVFSIVTSSLNDGGLKRIQACINEFDKDYFVTPVNLAKETRSLLKLIEDDIPPNKIKLTSRDDKPATLPAILMAGWVRWLNVLENDFETKKSSEELLAMRERINRLVLKAIESSEIQQQYIERQNLHKTAFDS